MAEIKIEKKNTPIWPWILGAVALIAVLIYLFSSGDERNEGDELTQTSTEESYATSDTLKVSRNSTAVLAFVNFIKEDPNKMELDHDFTNEALLRLTNATNAVAEQVGYDIQQDMSELNMHTDKIAADPFDSTHANSIKSAAEILATALQNIQKNAFSGLETEAEAVKNAAQSIQGNMLTLDQKEAVKNYFQQSADLLVKMTPTTTEL